MPQLPMSKEPAVSSAMREFVFGEVERLEELEEYWGPFTISPKAALLKATAEIAGQVIRMTSQPPTQQICSI
jgi:hypothetical protein